MPTKDRYADLIPVLQSIIDNIERDGLSRYDRMDVKFRPSLLRLASKSHAGKLFRYAVLFIDEITPILLRKVLHVEKIIPPTTYTFLIAAYMNIEQLALSIVKKDRAEDIMIRCLEQFLDDDGDDCWWDLAIDPYLTMADGTENKRKTMHIHGLARCNMLLIKLYHVTGNERYLDIAYRTILTTIKHHVIRRYSDNTVSVSYYPYTDDCTLNICSEFCQWAAMLLEIKHDDRLANLLHDMIELIVREQLTTGAFPYTAKQNEVPQPGKSTVDCHHTGTVLSNLIEVLATGVLDHAQQKRVIESVNLGMRYYYNAFFCEKTGEIKHGHPGPTQYGEAVIAMCKYLKYSELFGRDNSCRSEIEAVLPKTVYRMAKFINKRDGSCPSEKVVFWQKLNSIRWGNGVILQALTEFLLISTKKAKDV